MDLNKQFDRIESPQFSVKVLQYLQRKKEVLGDSYSDESGKFASSCSGIAFDIAELLLAEGRKPHIVCFRGNITQADFGIRESLKPLAFQEKGVTWGGHQICVCDGMALDPILGYPIPISEYTHAVFGEDVDTEVLVPEDSVQEFLDRRKRK